MSDPGESKAQHPLDANERQSVLFSNLLMQQFSMAMMLMGRAPGPGGEKAPPKDLEAARLFIDQIEMLQAKTKGNLSKEEEGLLKQTLMTLQMSFVDAVEEEQKGGAPAPKQEAPAAAPAESSAPAGPSAAPEEEPHKKFSKKY